jgi:hypothetical protein
MSRTRIHVFEGDSIRPLETGRKRHPDLGLAHQVLSSVVSGYGLQLECPSQ